MPDGMTIDRINNNSNYQPGNIRLATWKEQENNKRSNHFMTYNGKTKTMSEWADELNISYTLIRKRINVLKWSIERTLSTPARRKKPSDGLSS